MADTIVVDGRIVEFLLPSEQTDLWISGEFFVIMKDLLGSTVILNDQDLVILIFCLFPEGFYARL